MNLNSIGNILLFLFFIIIITLFSCFPMFVPSYEGFRLGVWGIAITEYEKLEIDGANGVAQILWGNWAKFADWVRWGIVFWSKMGVAFNGPELRIWRGM